MTTGATPADTANPHLIIIKMSAINPSPVSTLPSRRTPRGRGVTLEEAITIGPDPLHLAEAFGLSEQVLG